MKKEERSISLDKKTMDLLEKAGCKVFTALTPDELRKMVAEQGYKLLSAQEVMEFRRATAIDFEKWCAENVYLPDGRRLYFGDEKETHYSFTAVGIAEPQEPSRALLLGNAIDWYDLLVKKKQNPETRYGGNRGKRGE